MGGVKNDLIINPIFTGAYHISGGKVNKGPDPWALFLCPFLGQGTGSPYPGEV